MMAGPQAIERASLVLVLVLLALAAALGWAFAYTCMSDVPTHLEIASLVGSLLRGDSPPVAEFYQFRPQFYTNFGTEILAIPLFAFMGAASIAKVFFTICIVGIPLGMIACMWAVGRRVTPLMLLCLPYGYTTTLAAGNVNFIFSLVIGLFVLASLLGRSAPPSRRLLAAYAASWLLMALVHPAGTVVMLMLCGLVVLMQATRPPWTVAGTVRQAWPTLATMLPAVLTLGSFLVTSPAGAMEYQRSLFLRLRELAINYELFKLDRLELAWCLLLSGSIGITALWLFIGRLRGRPARSDLFLGLAGVFLLLYCVAPNKMSGGDAFVSRIQILPWFLLLLWCSAQPMGRRVTAAVLVAGLVIQSGFLVTWYRAHAVVSADVQNYLRLGQGIPRGAIALPVVGESRAFDAGGRLVTGKQQQFDHLHNIIAADRGAVFLENWNAHFRVANVMFRPERDPYADLWRHCLGDGNQVDPASYADNGNPDVAAGLLRYQARTGVRPGWLLVWRLPRDGDQWRTLEPLLRDGFEQVQGGPGPGVSGLYRAKGDRLPGVAAAC